MSEYGFSFHVNLSLKRKAERQWQEYSLELKGRMQRVYQQMYKFVGLRPRVTIFFWKDWCEGVTMSCKTDCYDLCDADTAEAKLVEKSTGQASMHTEPRYTLALDSQSVAAWILKWCCIRWIHWLLNIKVWTFHHFMNFHRFWWTFTATFPRHPSWWICGKVCSFTPKDFNNFIAPSMSIVPARESGWTITTLWVSRNQQLLSHCRCIYW